MVTATWGFEAGTHDVVFRGAPRGRCGAFSLPLTFGALDSTGAAHRTAAQILAADGAAQQVRIPLAAAPASVVLDPDVELLAALKVVHE